MPKWKTLFLASLLLFVGTSLLAQDKEIQGVEEANKRQIQVQKQAEKWAQEKEVIKSEIRQINTQTEWYDFQLNKYKKYVQREKKSIAALKSKKAEMETLRLKLEPYLKQMIHRLETYIAKDLPFLEQERQERIEYLKDSLYDYHLSLSEKLRRVLEAYQIEARYGKTIGVQSKTLEIGGKKLRADLLRIGRMAMFYRTLDGERLGKWDMQKNKWMDISMEYGRAIKKAINMAQQKQTVELVDLPIGGPNVD